ncbi:40S ribosomal protein S25 [Candidatus Bathyarchaeota archaeon]|nr:40S ribosomal protein S25 [Candidatus Bathyarchaeota archaeon]
MGGKKKRSIKSIEKTQKPKPKKKDEKAAVLPGEKGVPGIILPNLKDEELSRELGKMKYITPHSIASRFNVRLSIARAFLKEMERKGAISLVSRSRNITVYKPAN